MRSSKELLKLYKTCITINYHHVENNADYTYTLEDGHLTIYFQQTKGNADWLRNLQFPTRAFKNSNTKVRYHRGFLSVWNAVKSYIKEIIKDENIKSVTVVGYSHGAALATLCYEYIWFKREDLRNSIDGYGFGSPRVLSRFGLTEEYLERFKNFYVIANHTDIVTHVPPRLFGYVHVNKPYMIGGNQKYNCIDSHRDYAYIEALNNEN